MPTGKNATDEILRTVRETIDKKTVALPSGSRAICVAVLLGCLKRCLSLLLRLLRLSSWQPVHLLVNCVHDLATPALANTRLADVA